MPSAPSPLDVDFDAHLADAPPIASVQRPWPRRLVLASIALLATAVRIPGILWGLPHELHPDEPVIVHNAIDLIKRNSLVPHVFYRPDHLEILLSSFAYRFYAWVGPGVSAPTDYAAHPWRYLAISRGITVAFSVGAVLFAWCVGRRFSTASAVFAALFVAFFPPFVANSSYATPDMPLTCLMLAATLASMRYLERPTFVRLLLACAAVGVGVTIKYPAAIAGITVGTVVVIVMVRSRDWWRGVLHLLLAPVFFVLTVLAVSHVLITDLSEVMFQLRNQRGSDHAGAEALGWIGNLNFYARDYASWAGVVLLAAAVVGVWWCITARAIIAVPLLLGVVYWICLSEVPAHWERWALPMFLSPLLFAAVGFGQVLAWLQARWREKDRRSRLYAGVAAALMAVGALQLFTGSTVVAAGFAGGDTRVVAMPAFRAMGINHQNAISDGYTPLAPSGPESIGSSGHLVSRPGARFVVTSSNMYDRYFASDKYEAIQAVYRQVREQMPLLKQWAPVPIPKRSALEPWAILRALRYVYDIAGGGNTGPTISVYKIPIGFAHP